VEYLIAYAGFPTKAAWKWTAQAKMVGQDGKWTCPDAMAEFDNSKKK